jgi:hypothetical protein
MFYICTLFFLHDFDICSVGYLLLILFFVKLNNTKTYLPLKNVAFYLFSFQTVKESLDVNICSEMFATKSLMQTRTCPKIFFKKYAN